MIYLTFAKIFQPPIMNIHFIVNPVSGKGLGQKLQLEYLQKYFGSEFQISLHLSQRKHHAKELTEQVLESKPDAVVACGGDGTINEVGRYMIHTDIPMGIIAIGSGNGLSHHMNFGKSIESDMAKIKRFHTESIDVGKINDQYFFSNFGLGFAADVIKHYEIHQSRKLWGYIKAGFYTWAKINPKARFRLKLADQTEMEVSQIFCSNSNEMGYGMSITPDASLSDGLLDIVAFTPKNKIQFLTQCLLILTHQHKYSKSFFLQQTPEFSIITPDLVPIQIDGEFHECTSKELSIHILPKSLKLIC